MTTEEYNERIKINYAEYIAYQVEHEIDYIISEDKD